MIIDSKKYNGACSCGHTHNMTTEFCVIEDGALNNFEKYINQASLSGRSVCVYDENTYEALAGVRPKADDEIILPSENLHADNHGVEMLSKKLSGDIGYLIAAGSGTVHDLVRYCASNLGVPFVSCPTAASVDGFCSSVAAMTWHGYKKTLTCVAPKIVVADLNIIKKAPFRLTKSGFGDIAGKYIALSDWKIGNILTGEYFCEKIYNMTKEATDAVIKSALALKNGDTSAYSNLMYSLIMSGLAMQLLGNSRCASGAEHHISHLIEMQPEGLGVSSSALHGEKVGVGTLIAASYYHSQKNCSKWCDYPEITEPYAKKMFGEKLTDAIMKENENDACAGITKEQIIKNLSKIKSVINEIPTLDELMEIYISLDVKRSLSDIGASEDILPLILEFSPLVRNRLTFMRLLRAKGE